MEGARIYSSTLLSILALMLLDVLPKVASIGCFVCTSINGSEPDCEDTFNNTNRFYQTICMGGKRGHAGVFPGTECIKIKATLAAENITIMFRACAVENSELDSDRYVGAVDNCGFINIIRLNNVDYEGCIVACHTDGCNLATNASFPPLSLYSLIGLVLARISLSS